ncbi:uncharacterized protein SCHCODRAFT_02620422 [Schizophyllum commune H4-8]|uniref:uncharacterized protein n=1 Tax=Schizophyllum commune (strain H4-8 / FGSC 9210) TaxID=578458 RepID=UPI00215F90A8|nr:uncharacterized protein SCHCODRAFT_02620422 [Schizophyllum commune H4-8]KAI5895851.1 hypothetical protein SCHCODRAFT_02620422 [Schizophyllum commune H4-8]
MKLRTLSRVLSTISLSSSSSRHKSDKESDDERTSHEKSSERIEPPPQAKTPARSSRKPVDRAEAPPSAYRQQRLRRRATMDPRPISRPEPPADPPQKPAQANSSPRSLPLQRAARHTSLPPRPAGSSGAIPDLSRSVRSEQARSARYDVHSPARPEPLRPSQPHRIKRKPVPYHIIEGIKDEKASACPSEKARAAAGPNGATEADSGRRVDTQNGSHLDEAKPPVPPRSVRRATLASPVDYREYSRP